MIASREFFIVMDDSEPVVLIFNKTTGQQQRVTGRAAKEIINQIKYWEETH